MKECITVAGARILPVALVQDVVGEDAKRDFAPLAAGRVARAQTKEIVAGHADRFITRGFLAPGETPPRQNTQPSNKGNINIREGGRPKSRNVDDLLVVKRRSARVGRNGAQQRSAGGKT